MAGSWALGWLATWLVIVDIERGHHVFGASGALLVTVATSLAARHLLADRPAPAAEPVPAASAVPAVVMSRP